MPAKRTSSKAKGAASEPAVATRRSTRGASASNVGTKRKASPSPAPRRAASAKKGRTSSPSPAPSSRTSSRGRSAAPKKEETKASGRAASRKGHVTRADVEEVKKSTPRSSSRGSKTPTPKQATTPKGGSSAPKAKPETPKQRATTPRGKSATPKQKAATPKKAASTPKQKNTPKQKAVTPKQTPTPKKEPTPKQPAKKATPKTPPKKKTESPPKVSRSSRRSKAEAETIEEKVEKEEPAEEQETAQPDAPSDEKHEDTATAVDTGTAEVAKDVEKMEDASPCEDSSQAAEEGNKDEQETGELGAEAEEENEEQTEGEETVEPETKEELEPEVTEEEQPEEVEEEMDTEMKEVEEKEEALEEQKVNEEEIEPIVDETAQEEALEEPEVSEEEIKPIDTEELEAQEEEEEEVEEVQIEQTVQEESEKLAVNEDSLEQVEQLKAEEVTSDHSVKPSEDVVDFNRDASEAVVSQNEKTVVNDAINESSGDGSGEPENIRKTIEAEEISDDDIVEIKTTEAVVQDLGSNGDIENVMNQVNAIDDSNTSSSPTKRKIDEVDREDVEGSPVKKARISTEEEIQENGASSQDDIAKDYVVIEMGDVPQPDSQEVRNSLPNPVFNRVFLPNPGFSGSPDASRQFSLVSYNMLADCHLFRNDYSFTEDQFLKPEYRLKKVIEELQYLDADVVCMQEVDPDYFVQQLLPGLRRLGYEGMHKERQGGDYYFEGEATFFKTSRFTLVEAASFAFSELIEKEFVEGIDPTIQAAVRAYMDLPDVLIITKLRCNNTGLEVTIGNVHIQWGEMKLPDAQCVQIASAVKEVVSRASGDNFPHIICGDFNSPPMSPGYLVARDGYPSGDETINKLMKIEGLQLPDGKNSALVDALWPAFQHTSSSLRSAYSEAQGYEPEITSFNRVMCDTVDYIFYSSVSLENVGVFQTASKERIMETGGIPDHFFPSDHVSLKAVLAFK